MDWTKFHNILETLVFALNTRQLPHWCSIGKGCKGLLSEICQFSFILLHIFFLFSFFYFCLPLFLLSCHWLLLTFICFSWFLIGLSWYWCNNLHTLSGLLYAGCLVFQAWPADTIPHSAPRARSRGQATSFLASWLWWGVGRNILERRDSRLNLGFWGITFNSEKWYKAFLLTNYPHGSRHCQFSYK